MLKGGIRVTTMELKMDIILVLLSSVVVCTAIDIFQYVMDSRKYSRIVHFNGGINPEAKNRHCCPPIIFVAEYILDKNNCSIRVSIDTHGKL